MAPPHVNRGRSRIAALAFAAAVACTHREALAPATRTVSAPCPTPAAEPAPSAPSPRGSPAVPGTLLGACSGDGRPVPEISRAGWSVAGPAGGDLLALAAEAGTSTAYGGAHGVWKTTDGRTWARAPGVTGYVRALATDPRRAGIVYAAADEGLFRSDDAGATWQLLSSLGLPCNDPVGRYVPYTTCGITAVAAPPWITVRTPAGTILAGTDGLGLWRSVDDGAHWQRAALVPATTVDSIAFDPAHSDVVYATGVQSENSKWMGAVYRSTDGGVQWSMTSLQAQQELREVFVDPALPNVVYAGGHGLFESRDAGKTWEQVVKGSVFRFAAYDEARVHVRLASALAGVYRKTAGARDWTLDPPGSGLPAQPWARAIVALAKGRVLTATRVGVLASDAQGCAWTPAVAGMTEMEIEIVGAGPAASGVVYAPTTLGGAYRSLDGGTSWTKGEHPDEVELPTGVAVEQLHPERAWLTGGAGLYRTTDAGATWRPVLGIKRTRCVAIDPSDESVVYVGTDEETVLRSADGFRTWTTIELPGFPVNALAVSPGVPPVLWVASFDGFCGIDLSAPAPRCGSTFRTRHAGAIAVAPESAGSTVHVATDDGVLVTTNRGARWTRLAQPARYTSLQWAAGALFASSMTRGLEVSCDEGVTFEPVGVGGATRVPGFAVAAGERLEIYGGTIEGVYRATVR